VHACGVVLGFYQLDKFIAAGGLLAEVKTGFSFLFFLPCFMT